MVSLILISKTLNLIYEYPGLYTVKLMATDSSGYITDTILKEDLIELNGIVAEFEANPVLWLCSSIGEFFNTQV